MCFHCCNLACPWNMKGCLKTAALPALVEVWMATGGALSPWARMLFGELHNCMYRKPALPSVFSEWDVGCLKGGSWGGLNSQTLRTGTFTGLIMCVSFLRYVLFSHLSALSPAWLTEVWEWQKSTGLSLYWGQRSRIQLKATVFVVEKARIMYNSPLFPSLFPRKAKRKTAGRYSNFQI